MQANENSTAQGESPSEARGLLRLREKKEKKEEVGCAFIQRIAQQKATNTFCIKVLVAINAYM